MQSFLRILHVISYLKFVFLLLGIGYVYYPFFDKTVNQLDFVGLGLIFIGIGLSFDALRDTNVVDKYSKKFYQKPKMVISFVIVFLLIFVGLLGFSFYIMNVTENQSIRNIAIGLICTCLGGVSLVRQIIETSRKIQRGEIA
jgi:hypothetical protein